MLPKQKRVKKAVFHLLLKEGKSFSTGLFSFYSRKSKFPQYTFVTPKNIFKGAVKRNKFRRTGYNILRSLTLKSGSGIFIYKNQAISATQEKIKDDIIFILRKTGFLE
jgi:ribonuclease P protein component